MAPLADDAPQESRTPAVTPRSGETYSSGEGWVAFACLILFLAGTMNVIGGIAAIGDSKFFTGAAGYIVGDLETLGWVLLVVGIIQILAPIGIRAQSFAAVWIGVVSAGLNGMAHLLLMPAAPFWCLSVLALDVAVIYGLIVYADAE